MSTWQLIKNTKVSGPENMQTDLKLFQDFEKGLIPPSLRLYSWEPACVSLGYSQKSEELIDCRRAEELGWEVVKRPTGGGIVFHNEAEITYSLITSLEDPILPEGLIPSYIKISQAIIRGLSFLGIKAQLTTNRLPLTAYRLQNDFCFGSAAEYEIVVGGRKLVGSAQKRGKRTLLQQGSILVRNDLNGILSVLKEPIDKEGYAVRTISIEEILGREVSFEELSMALVKGFEEEFDVQF